MQTTPRKPKPICGARPRNVATNTRTSPCQCKKLLKGGKCRFHGGMSTGPKTPEGKARSREAGLRNLRLARERRKHLEKAGT